MIVIWDATTCRVVSKDGEQQVPPKH